MRNLTKFMMACLILVLTTTSHATGTLPTTNDANASIPGETQPTSSWPPIWWPSGK